MAYGDKRDYPKIRLYVDRNKGRGLEYHATTTWAKTCKEAKEKFLETFPHFKPENVSASFKE